MDTTANQGHNTVEKSRINVNDLLLLENITAPRDDIALLDTLKSQSLKEDTIELDKKSTDEIETFKGRKLKWLGIFWISLFHALFLLCILIKVPPMIKFYTWILCIFRITISVWGATAGAHRLWSHRSYKVNYPLKIIILLCQVQSGQTSVYSWVLDHRVHHKYTDTKADPHNSNYGFFYSHIGWLMLRKDPEVIRRGRQVDMSDILSDPLLAFQKEYWFEMAFMVKALFLLLAHYTWNEGIIVGFFATVVIPLIISLHFTFTINSFSHMYGMKPYDRRIAPTENLAVAIMALGEGWHNYHHSFPWDYKAAELDGNYAFNFTAFLIDMFAKIGWAYDLKRASPKLIEAVGKKYGDGTHTKWGHKEIPEEANERIELIDEI